MYVACRSKRHPGAVTRQLTLGEGLDADHLTAAYADGVLHVTIPASPKVQPRRIKMTHRTGAQPAAGSTSA
jgi:HSP20 family protein